MHYETFCSVKLKYETFRSNDTFFEIHKSSSKAYFLHFIGYFSQIQLEYPIFLPIYETFRFKDQVRMTTDSNLLLMGFEYQVLMGLEPIRDNGGNKYEFMIK